jgi:hypothetical protein
MQFDVNELSQQVKALKKAESPREFIRALNEIEENHISVKTSMLGLLSPFVDQALTRALRFIHQDQNIFVLGDSSNKDSELWLVRWEDESEWSDAGWKFGRKPLGFDEVSSIADAMVSLVALSSDRNSQGNSRIFLEDFNSVEDFLDKVYRAGFGVSRVMDAGYACLMMEHCFNDNGFTVADFGEDDYNGFVNGTMVVDSNGKKYTINYQIPE